MYAALKRTVYTGVEAVCYVPEVKLRGGLIPRDRV